jgi:hypothetical protein
MISNAPLTFFNFGAVDSFHDKAYLKKRLLLNHLDYAQTLSFAVSCAAFQKSFLGTMNKQITG